MNLTLKEQYRFEILFEERNNLTREMSQLLIKLFERVEELEKKVEILKSYNQSIG